MLVVDTSGFQQGFMFEQKMLVSYTMAITLACTACLQLAASFIVGILLFLPLKNGLQISTIGRSQIHPSWMHCLISTLAES